ncbi:Sodium-coupled neutral amino acid transporter 3 [Chelonia mydas]|uniref:Sodium-coupled neutral amino acid transporter 3 n=1 Tax=Chelonia mydas TaxID=8469 RepID=M7AVB4_CHEMY|nr:Sodium-coupled neutral amino acid transporter 3 [Chelonia mydas]
MGVSGDPTAEVTAAEQEGFLPHAAGKKLSQFTDFEGKTSFGMSVFNLSNAIMGSGILGLAYAMSNTGIVLFVVLLICIALLSTYSIHLLLKCAGVVGIRAYEELGYRAFGPGGKVVAAVVICVHNTGAMSSYLYIVKYELPLVIQTFLGLTENTEASKRRMQNVANVSILAMFVMYLLTAIFGYLTFYGNVESEMLHTYSEVDPLDRLILCVRLAVLMAVTLTVPVVLFPIRRAIQQLLFHGKDFSWIRHVSIAIGLLFVVNLLVIFVPNIRDIFGVIGATSAPSLIFILPSIFYLRIVPNEKEPLRSRPKIQAACFAALGFIFMVMSLSFIVADWVTTGRSRGGGH